MRPEGSELSITQLSQRDMRLVAKFVRDLGGQAQILDTKSGIQRNWEQERRDVLRRIHLNSDLARRISPFGVILPDEIPVDHVGFGEKGYLTSMTGLRNKLRKVYFEVVGTLSNEEMSSLNDLFYLIRRDFGRRKNLGDLRCLLITGEILKKGSWLGKKRVDFLRQSFFAR